MFTAWSHNNDSKVLQGTFLKSIALLPYLKKMNIDIIYLLPIFEYSEVYKRGDLGCPYAIKNIYKIDRHLHDSLLGEYNEEVISIELKAFIEACHILGIKVMIDFVFRTVSRDNDMMINHPEWFYWIKEKDKNKFCAPKIEEIEGAVSLTEEHIKYIYSSSNITKYLSMFSDSPKDIDINLWNKILREHNDSGENILNLIEQKFGITTAPGFSDVINDAQPPWTDVTYIKIYFDLDKVARKFLNKEFPPYVLYDNIKLNVIQGQEVNTELWNYIVNVIPYYQQQFGIDGARIDMGHALPAKLNEEIISKVRGNNKNFIFWSEEFDTAKSNIAKQNGFDFISGATWADYNYINTKYFNESLLNKLYDICIPVAASVETPDTPRAALLNRDKKKLESIILINLFLPSSVPFINNGLDSMEIQPMNLGLGNSKKGRFTLEKTDPMYGKLAFFDNYKIHWTNKDANWMRKLLIEATNIRKKYINIIKSRNNLININDRAIDGKLTVICYFDATINKGIILISNRRANQKIGINIGHILPENIRGIISKINIDYCQWGTNQLQRDIYEDIILKGREVIIGQLM